MADRQNTTYPNITLGDAYGNGIWGLGSSTAGSDPQFPSTNSKLPSAEKLWPNYHAWVLRGDNDGEYIELTPNEALPLAVENEGSSTTFSRTFSENNPTDLTQVRVGGGGWPACPYQPSVAVTDGTTGFNYALSAQGPVLGPQTPWPDESGATSLASPNGTSDAQLTNGQGDYPTYQKGKWSTT